MDKAGLQHGDGYTVSGNPVYVRILPALFAEKAGNAFIEHSAKRLDGYAVKNISRKRMQQDTLSLLFGHSAGTQVKQGFGIKLACGCAVAAFYVIGVNLQLRLGVHRGLVCEHDGFVFLEGIDALCVLPHEDLPIEYAGSAVIQNALVQFVADAVRLGMIHEGMVVHLRVAAGKKQTIQVRFAMRGIGQHIQIVPDDGAGKRYSRCREGTRRFLVDMCG